MSAGAQHAAQRLERLLGAETGGVVAQQLGQADDRVQRRAQLVAHIGEEARFRPVRLHRLVARGFEVPDHLGELGLALFDRRDVGPGRDRPALLRAYYDPSIGDSKAWFEKRLALHRNAPSVHEQKLADGTWLRVGEHRTQEGGTVTTSNRSPAK